MVVSAKQLWMMELLVSCGSNSKLEIAGKTRQVTLGGTARTQAHHLIPKNAFKLKNATSKQVREKMMFLRRIAQMCAYNIDFWKNGVALPNKKATECYLKKPRHAGGTIVMNLTIPMSV
nr:AHH domain-containing protein [Vibrio lentus]